MAMILNVLYRSLVQSPGPVRRCGSSVYGCWVVCNNRRKFSFGRSANYIWLGRGPLFATWRVRLAGGEIFVYERINKHKERTRVRLLVRSDPFYNCSRGPSFSLSTVVEALDQTEFYFRGRQTDWVAQPLFCNSFFVYSI